MGQLLGVQKVRVLKHKLCTRCLYATSPFKGEVCQACERVARNLASGVARNYVADYFRDHPMQAPRSARNAR